VALEQYARIVDEISRGAEQLRKSLSDATKSLREQRTLLSKTVQGIGRTAPGGQRVLNLDRQGAVLNARAITRALQAGGAEGTGRSEGPSAVPGALWTAGEHVAGRAIGLPGRVLMRALRMFGARGGTAAAAAAGTGGGGGAAAGGAAASGAAALGTAATLVGAIVALVSSIVLAAKFLGKLAAGVREAAEASLEAKRKYAEVVPAIAAVISRKEVFELQERARRGRRMAPLAEAEWRTYQRWTEQTRNIELLGETTSVVLKLAFREALLPVLRLLDPIANAALKWLPGISEKDRDIKGPLGHPILRAFEFMRKGWQEQYFGEGRFPRRPKPPKPINMGPGE